MGYIGRGSDIGDGGEITLTEEALIAQLSALGSPLYVLRVNALGTGLEYAQVSSSSSWGSITGTLSNQTDLATALSGKSDTSHNHSGVYEPADATILKDADIGVSVAAFGHNHTGVYAPALGADDNYVTDAQLVVIGNTSGTNTGDNATNTQYSGLATSKQDTLVSGTNIKTINSTSLLGSGDIAVQATLISGTNIKTVNGNSLLGSGDVTISSAVAWGGVTGTLSNQTDLQTALDGKVDENVAITGATKTKITYDAKGLVTSGADATTADIADSLNKRYVTDANLTVIGNTSGTNTGDNATNTQYSGLAASKQDASTNLTSVSGLTYVSASFVKMTAAGTFALDTNTYLTTVTAHNLLSATHGDTLADTVVRGDVMIGNATPKWSRLAFPASPTGKVLQATATDVAWSTNPITIGASASVSGSNTGDQTSISGITGTKAQFDTACTDGNFLYVGDVTSNATHTGDATGSTALTVVKIQGKDFPTLGAGDDQKYPKYDNATNAFIMTTIAGGGNVSNTGTPANNQIAVWTNSTTVEGDTALTFDTTTDTLATPNITTTGTLTLAAGGGTNVPLSFPAGTLKATPADGDIEMDGDALYGCTDAGNRGVIPIEYIIRADATRTFTSNTTQQAIFNSPAGGTLTLETGTYLFEGLIAMTSMSATSGNGKFSLNNGGTATLGAILWQAYGNDNTAETTGAATGGSWHVIATETAANISTAATGTALCFLVKGTFEVTGAGTIIPSFAQTTAAAAIVSIGSYIKFNRIGSTTMTNVGQWT